MNKYILVFQIQNPDGLKDIFDGNVISALQENIGKGYKNAVKRLLGRHYILSDIISPFFGLWYVLFSIKQLDRPVDVNEQIETLTAFGEQLIRTMLQQNLGVTIGAVTDFKLVIIPMPEKISEPNGIINYIETSLKACPSISKSYTDINKDEFSKIIDTKNIEIYLQPIVSLPRENVVGYEALSKGPINSPVREAIELFGAASHFNLREELEMVCISKALDWAMKLPEPYWMSINIGPDLIIRPSFYDFITQQRFNELLPQIMLEITERLPIPRVEKFQKVIQKLKKLGIKLAVDDTGCGFANIDTVEIVLPRIVKLRVAIIHNIGRYPHIERYIHDFVAKIKELGGEVLGEGVEQKEQIDILKNSGASFAQGYYYAYPKPAKDVLEALTNSLT